MARHLATPNKRTVFLEHAHEALAYHTAIEDHPLPTGPVPTVGGDDDLTVLGLAATVEVVD